MNIPPELEREMMENISEQLEATRALAEHYAHRIYPKSGERLVEVKKVDGHLYIVLTSDGGHIDEFGSVDQPPNAPLRRAIDATGMRFEADISPE